MPYTHKHTTHTKNERDGPTSYTSRLAIILFSDAHNSKIAI